MPALRHRPDARLHGRPGLHLQADQDPRGADLTDGHDPGSSTSSASRACLVGVGNPLRRDDGVGPWIVAALREAAAGTGLALVDAQDVPENFVPAIARGEARNVVFVDAVAADRRARDRRLRPPGRSRRGRELLDPQAGPLAQRQVPRGRREEGLPARHRPRRPRIRRGADARGRAGRRRRPRRHPRRPRPHPPGEPS
ncbi:MAG: hydrogenase maturation protease [Candidatus Moduliflexus flocculans]|nr:hydrogenase maturation protease [Candidatus Moduliflexus flocculans]